MFINKTKLAKIKTMSIGKLLFLIERTLAREFYNIMSLRPSSEPFLSGDTYRRFATKEYQGGHLELDQAEIVFSSTDRLDELVSNVNKISHPFILITHHSDRLVSDSYRTFANSHKLIHWFAQNSILNHPKVTTIPIGLEDRWRHDNGIIRDYVKLRQKEHKKISRIFVSFSTVTNPVAREPALEILRQLEITDHFRGNSRQYRKQLVKYMFVASPQGNGIDCHRTWEALYLGVIPIVTTRDFHDQFPLMPALIVDEWSDLRYLAQDDLTEIYDRELKKIKGCNYIWSNYWRLKIKLSFEAISK